MVPTIEELEQYFDYIEHVVTNALAAASPDLPGVQETFNRLWLDISRFGPHRLPSLPDIHVPGLGAFEVPPPPPPPPPPRSWVDNAGDYVAKHPWITSGMVISALGAGLLVGYSVVRTGSSKRRRVSRPVEKRQAIVILGGDHPLGLSLIVELERQGYIVITSVSSPEAVGDIESMGHGYVRALILDPNEPGTIPIFLRSLASVLSRRFPITTAGDPYAPTPYHPLVHSVISLLTMSTTSVHCAPAPFEQISLRSTYLPHLLSAHIAPLQTIQALLPLLRMDASRTPDQKSIILCLPAADARMGLPFGGVSAMTAAATLRAADVLRREIATAIGMNAIRIVTIDVGEVGPPKNDPGAKVDMDDWTPSEKAAYGAAFSTLRETRGSRVPADVSTFVNSLVSVVSAGTKAKYSGKFVLGIGIGLVYEKVKNWVRGNRFSVGAGAGTYAIASYLPPVLLDSLLVLPYFLVDLRNRLSSGSSTWTDTSSNRAVGSIYPTPQVECVPGTKTTSSNIQRTVERVSEASDVAAVSESQVPVDEHEIGSDADVESNDGDLESTGVGSSWINCYCCLNFLTCATRFGTPQVNSGMGVSLWLVPAAIEMDAIISSLPRRPSIDHSLSPRSYPVFLPHITLATVPFLGPGIQDALLDSVLENQKPVRANFQSLTVGDHYFRSVFIDIQPTQELVGLQAEIVTNLRSRGFEPSAPRFPHMSLCYIADEDENERGRMAQVLRDSGTVSQATDPQSISLRCSDVSLTGFNGAEIWVAKCEGPVETWEVDEGKVILTV